MYHLDDLSLEIEKIKYRYLKRFLIEAKDNKGKSISVINPRIKTNHNELYEKIKIDTLKSFIKSKILSERLKGAKYIIIEGTQLSTYLSGKDIDYRILIERAFEERMKDIMIRDNLTEKEFNQREEYDKNKKSITGRNNITIENNTSIDQVVKSILNYWDRSKVER